VCDAGRVQAAESAKENGSSTSGARQSPWSAPPVRRTPRTDPLSDDAAPLTPTPPTPTPPTPTTGAAPTSPPTPDQPAPPPPGVYRSAAASGRPPTRPRTEPDAESTVVGARDTGPRTMPVEHDDWAAPAGRA